MSPSLVSWVLESIQHEPDELCNSPGEYLNIACSLGNEAIYHEALRLAATHPFNIDCAHKRYRQSAQYLEEALRNLRTTARQQIGAKVLEIHNQLFILDASGWAKDGVVGNRWIVECIWREWLHKSIVGEQDMDFSNPRVPISMRNSYALAQGWISDEEIEEIVDGAKEKISSLKSPPSLDYIRDGLRYLLWSAQKVLWDLYAPELSATSQPTHPRVVPTYFDFSEYCYPWQNKQQ